MITITFLVDEAIVAETEKDRRFAQREVRLEDCEEEKWSLVLKKEVAVIGLI